jgi:hypothetical protein
MKKENIKQDIKIHTNENFNDYINKIDNYIRNTLNTRYSSRIYGWAEKANLILNIQKKYFLDCI